MNNKSSCCNAEVRVEGRTTTYYPLDQICTKCGKKCDAVPPAKGWKDEWRKLKCHMTVAGGMCGWENNADENFIEEKIKEAYEDVIKEIDHIEMNHHNTTMDEWRLYKHIRNSLRDKFSKL